MTDDELRAMAEELIEACTIVGDGPLIEDENKYHEFLISQCTEYFRKVRDAKPKPLEGYELEDIAQEYSQRTGNAAQPFYAGYRAAESRCAVLREWPGLSDIGNWLRENTSNEDCDDVIRRFYIWLSSEKK